METSAPHTRAAWGAKVVTELIKRTVLGKLLTKVKGYLRGVVG